MSWIGYATVESPANPGAAEALQPVVDLLGADPWHAWLENETAPEGLKLRDDVVADEAMRLMCTWPQGRLFSEQADVRWERLANGNLHIVAIADVALPSPIAGSLELTAQRAPESALLWGTFRDGEWREERIPRISGWYPSAWKGPSAALRVQQFAAPWHSAQPESASVRLVTRLLGFDGNHQPVDLTDMQALLATSEEETDDGTRDYHPRWHEPVEL